MKWLTATQLSASVRLLFPAVLFSTSFLTLAWPAPPVSKGPDSIPLDLVVRDKHGHDVRDLRPSEIQITEDGAPVKIETLHLETAGQAGAERQLRLISLVFDGTDEAANDVGREALAEISKQLGPSHPYFSVWQIRGRLSLVQAFTDDETALKAAIESASRSRRRGASKNENAAGGVHPTAATLSGTDAAAQKQISEATTKILDFSEQLVRERHARPTLAGLMAIAKEQRSLPGRKIVVYISDALNISTSSTDQLRAVIGEANRGAVTFYTVDLSGVGQRARDDAAHMVMDTEGIAGRLSQVGVAEGLGVSNSTESFKGKRKATVSSQIRELAVQTGGTCLDGSSDVRKFMRGVAEDAATYYQATYSPGKMKYDGHFLPLNVKVDRPQVRVQSPAGYFAVPPGDTSGVEGFELPLLQALSANQMTETIWFDGAVMRHGQTGEKTQADLLVQVPLSGLLAREDDTSKLFRMHLSLVALIKDHQGKVVEKLSQDLGLQGALEQLQQARKDVYTLQRPFAVTPGEYHADIAIEDQNASKLSAKMIRFSIPRNSPGLALSDLIVVRRIEPPAGSVSDTELLRYKNMRVVPDINSRGKRVADPRHPVFFEVFPEAGAAEKPRVGVELRRGATVIAHVPVQLDDAAAGEPIRVLAALNTPVAPGDYTLFAAVTQGGVSREKEVSLAMPEEASESQPEDTSLKQEDHPEETTYGKLTAAPQLIPNTPKPSDAEITAMLSGARARVDDYRRTLPNFVCMRVTKRFVDPTGQGAWKPRDSYVNLLRYVDGEETAVLLQLDGRRATDADDNIQGALVKGEFGELLNMVFAEKAKAAVQWVGVADVSGVRTQVFRFSVTKPHSLYEVMTGNSGAGSVVAAAYHALVYVDTTTLGVRRIAIEAEDLPKNFHIRESAIAVDYDYVPISGQEYLLPLNATLYVRQGTRFLRRNDIEFQNYRKYGAESTLKSTK